MANTRHYNLKLFESTDHPTWLTDWNDTITNIDNALYRIATGGGDLPDLTEVVARLQALEGRVDSDELRLNVVESDIVSILSDLQNIRDDITALASRVTVNESDIADLKTQANTTLPGQISAINDSISGIIASVSANTTAISGLDTRVTALENSTNFSNAGYHNSIYRGQSLGTSVSSEQYSNIQSGSFDNMFIGDYWTINGVIYRIACFDYWLKTGDSECTNHHVVLVPDSSLYLNKMNDTNTTTGGYVGSKMYTTYLNTAKNEITTAFGSSHILTHRELLTTSVSNGIASAWAWHNSSIELMNEIMVYGCASGSKPVTNSLNFDIGIDKTQLPLFTLEPSRIIIRTSWWLRSIVSSSTFANVDSMGGAYDKNASVETGVRPAFAIYSPNI